MIISGMLLMSIIIMSDYMTLCNQFSIQLLAKTINKNESL